MMRVFRERSHTDGTRHGVTLVEVLVCIGIAGILMSLLLPSIQAARETARAATCMNHLRQLTTASHSFVSVHGHFPPTSTTWSLPSGQQPAVSTFRHLMAHLEPHIFQKIDFKDVTAPTWTNSPCTHLSPRNEELNRIGISVLLCPSDSEATRGTNYRCNLGISAHLFGPQSSIFGEPTAERGAFVHGRSVKPAEFRDGLSTTALFSERVQGDGRSGDYSPFQDLFSDPQITQGTENVRLGCQSFASLTPTEEFSFAGKSWLLGGWLHTWYSHISPPNWRVPDCGLGSGVLDGGDMVVSARSFHLGRVHVAMADGAVRVTSNSITQTIWSEMGTRAGSN